MPMKLIIASALLFAIIFNAHSGSYDVSRFGPYDPYRFAGGRYWSLMPMYQNLGGAPPPALAGWKWFYSEGPPGSRPWRDGETRFSVQQILPDGAVRIDCKTARYALADQLVPDFDHSSLVLLHYPGQAALVDGQALNFLALHVGNRQYHDADGVIHTVPCYDYGTPYDPFALAQKSMTNHVKLTNGVPSKSHSVQ